MAWPAGKKKQTQNKVLNLLKLRFYAVHMIKAAQRWPGRFPSQDKRISRLNNRPVICNCFQVIDLIDAVK